MRSLNLGILAHVDAGKTSLTERLLLETLARAGTRVYEPTHRFTLEVPADTYATVMPVLVRHGGIPLSCRQSGDGYVVEGDLPAARVHALTQRLPALTRGEGVLESDFDHYRPLRPAMKGTFMAVSGRWSAPTCSCS